MGSGNAIQEGSASNYVGFIIGSSYKPSLVEDAKLVSTPIWNVWILITPQPQQLGICNLYYLFITSSMSCDCVLTLIYILLIAELLCFLMAA